MFRTPAGQARYFAAYDETLALWGVPVEALTVSTRLGPTHINACGPHTAPPLVLLPGAAMSASMWYPNAAALSQAYRVYALDVPGDMGKSVSVSPVKKQAQYDEWLGDVLDGLNLKQTHLGGLSAGGAHALSFAAAAPARVGKLILMSPASLLPIRPQFYARIATALLPFFSAEKRQALILGTASPNIAAAIKQLFTPTDFQYQMFFPPTATEAMLRQIQSPTLLLLGEREIVYDPQAARRRAQKYLTRLQAHILPNAGHALNFDQPEMVNAYILKFLNKQ